MLPDDAKARRQSTGNQLQQTVLDGHLEERPVVIPYSDTLFQEAAIQWLIETDQVCFLPACIHCRSPLTLFHSPSKLLSIRHLKA